MFYRHVNVNKSVGGDGERDQFKLSEQHQNIFCLIISVIFLDKLLKKFLLTVRRLSDINLHILPTDEKHFI